MSGSYETALVRHVPEQDAGPVVIPAAWYVAAGEYASEGEPDALIRIELAVDDDGNDISEQIARRIAGMLTNGAPE